MEKISWKDKKTNEENLRMVQEDRKILNTVLEFKHNMVLKEQVYGLCVTA